MIKRIVFGAALALVIAGISAPDASALCNPPKFVASFNSVTGEYVYWQVADLTNSAQTSMQSIANGGQDVGGTCNFIYWGANPGNVGLSGDYGQACALPATRPCPSGNLSIIGQAGPSFFGATVSEGAGPLGYDFSTVPGAVNHIKNTGQVPRPKVNTSSRAGSSVVLSLQLDGANASPGFDAATAATITGYNVLSATGTTDPGRLASAYTLLVNAPASGGGPASVASTSVDCSNIAQDRWIVTQIVTTAGPFSGVGPATQVKCNPALADPKYKPIKRAHPGNKEN